MVKWLKIDATFSQVSSFVLAALPFVVIGGAYIAVSEISHRLPDEKKVVADKVMPTISEIGNAFFRYAGGDTKPEMSSVEKAQAWFSGIPESRLTADTIASGRRFGIGLGVLLLGVLLGLNMGLLPFFEKLFLRFILFFDKISPLALLPILFLVFGLEETSKVALIVIGVGPTLILDTYAQTRAVPRENIIKGKSLGASDFEVAYRIVLPQIFPKVLDTFRLNFKSTLIFLISAEALAATVGLGYRIFVVRRYMAMDTILAYVVWMSMLVFMMDYGVRRWIRWRYPWVNR